MKSILYLTNYPSPYRVQFFKELGRCCELTVLFEETPEEQKHRNMKWFCDQYENFQAVFLKKKRIKGKTISTEIFHWLGKKYDAVIVGVYSTLTAQLAIEYMRWKKIPFYIETDGGSAKNGKGIKELWKKYLISAAQGWFSPSKISDEYLKFYGADEKKIIRYPFSSLKDREILRCPLDNSEKLIYKQKLNVNEKYMILTVGQFIYRKANDVLIKAAVGLDDRVGVYIVGGHATKEYYELIEENHLKNIHFVDFRMKDDLRQYYLAADVFVLPTREDIWGLVINEAMSVGLPIIATNKCGAALELIEDSENGYIISSDDTGAITERIQELINDDEKRKKMGIKAIQRIQECTIERMVEVHIQYLL